MSDRPADNLDVIARAIFDEIDPTQVRMTLFALDSITTSKAGEFQAAIAQRLAASLRSVRAEDDARRSTDAQ